MINVLLVTSWGTPCGIAEHSRLIKEGVEAADPEIRIIPSAAHLDPAHLNGLHSGFEIVHLNHHDALHSRWTAEHVALLQQHGRKVVVTWHDTYAGTPEQPNSEKAHQFHDLADAFIVHEPVEDLPKAIHWRHGVPAVQTPMAIPDGRPVIGSAGFNFGWKNFDLLCEAAALAGWRVLLIGPGFTGADVARWRQWQPEVIVPTLSVWGASDDPTPRDDVAMPAQADVVAWLSSCDATCFLYNNMNSGVSGAVRFGIAARKPCLLMDKSRQFRDLQVDPGLSGAFYWTRYHTETIAEDMSHLPCVKWDHRLCAVAERDSYKNVGRRYASLYRELIGADRR